MDKNLKKYDCIDIIPWITENYDKQLITYSVNHVSYPYVEYLLNEIVCKIDSNIDYISVFDESHNYQIPDPLYPIEFKWFSELFPNLIISNLDLDRYKEFLQSSKYQLKEFSKCGMDAVRNAIPNINIEYRFEPEVRAILGID